MSDMKAAISHDGEWFLTDNVKEIFAANGNAIFVNSPEALKAELQKRYDGGLEPGLTKVRCGRDYQSVSFRIEEEPIIDSDKIKTQESLEALCRKVGKVKLTPWANSGQVSFDRSRYDNHPEFFYSWEHLTYDPAKKSAMLKKKATIQRRLDNLGTIRNKDLRLMLSALHDAIYASPFGEAIQRFRYPPKTTRLMSAIVECYKIATFVNVRDKARANKGWKAALTKIAPLLRKHAQNKGANQKFVSIATNEYRLAGINIRILSKEKKHGKEV